MRDSIDNIVPNQYCKNILFVLYDSANVITVIENLNENNFDIRPHRDRSFVPLK